MLMFSKKDMAFGMLKDPRAWARVLAFVAVLALVVAAVYLSKNEAQAQAQGTTTANQARKLIEYERRKAEALEDQVEVLEDIQENLDQIERRCR